jgi:hypothetical protein
MSVSLRAARGVYAKDKLTDQGRYHATLDGQTNTYDGFTAEPGEIQAVLFSQTGLDAEKEHTLVSAKLCGHNQQT